jgi:hypothetical protein
VNKAPGATKELFRAVNVAFSYQARVFVTVIHFHPSLIFVGKARRFTFVWSYTPVGSSLARKYKTRMEVNRNTVANYDTATNTKLTSFIVQAPVLPTNIRLG